MDVQENINEVIELNNKYKLELIAKNQLIDDLKVNLEKEKETVKNQYKVIVELKAKVEKAEDDFALLIEKVLEKI